jgi:hypothetical protein
MMSFVGNLLVPDIVVFINGNSINLPTSGFELLPATFIVNRYLLIIICMIVVTFITSIKKRFSSA